MLDYWCHCVRVLLSPLFRMMPLMSMLIQPHVHAVSPPCPCFFTTITLLFHECDHAFPRLHADVEQCSQMHQQCGSIFGISLLLYCAQNARIEINMICFQICPHYCWPDLFQPISIQSSSHWYPLSESPVCCLDSMSMTQGSRRFIWPNKSCRPSFMTAFVLVSACPLARTIHLCSWIWKRLTHQLNWTIILLHRQSLSFLRPFPHQLLLRYEKAILSD